MPGNIIPLNAAPQTALAHPAAPRPPQAWGPPSAPPPPASSGPKLQRHLAVLARFKWLILLVTVLGTAAGVVYSRFVDPTYEVQASIWIASESPLTDPSASGARSSELVSANAWATIFRTGAVTDDVVRRLGLYIQHGEAADSTVFQGFQIDTRMRPGFYELRVDETGRGYRLLYDGQQVVEAGAVGDSIGRSQGFRWQPPAAELRAGRTVEFTVVPPREAVNKLNQSLTASQQETLLRLTLEGEDPERLTEILEAWVTNFVAVATSLKQQKLADYSNQVTNNLERSQRELIEAEQAYQRFKVGAITEPTEGTPVAAGVQETQPTVYSEFMRQRFQLDELQTSRRELQRILADTRARGSIGEADLYQLTTIQGVANNPGLSTAIAELTKRQADRRAMLAIFTDSAQQIRELDQTIVRLQTVTIPGLINSVITQLAQQERVVEQRLAAGERELREIPQRSTQEQQLARDVNVKEQIYSTLLAKSQQAQLAAESATADISILDYPVAPLRPSKNTVPQILGIAVLGSLALAILLAFVIDRIDQRFRYPEQAKDDLGLDILGAVPRLRAAVRGESDADEAAQVLEAFRLIRLNVRQALEESGVVLTVSSPAAGDGKSLVSSNLAVAFAEAGHRVLLIDGDIRRGSLHAAFGVSQRPGLSEVLAGAAPRKEALRPTAHRNLTLLPCGKRVRQAPELLDSATMQEMLQQLRATYDVVIVDSPPLSAGLDAYALGRVTGAMVIVLRAGKTNMRLAHAKLADLDRHPVFAVGAVLNGITPKGIYEYYNYGYGYAAEDEEPMPEESAADEAVSLPTASMPQIGEPADPEPSARS